MSRSTALMVVRGWLVGASKRRLARELRVTRRAVQQWAAGICLPVEDRIVPLALLCGRTVGEGETVRQMARGDA
jgi:hypothetical protein